MLSKETILKIENEYKQKIDSILAKDVRSYARYTNWAGDLGFECDTYQAVCRLHPELKPLPPLNLIKVFRTGKEWETPNIQLMQNSGIKIVEQARPFQWKEKQISGRIDAKIGISINGDNLVIPLEHKTCNDNSFRAILDHKIKEIPLTKSKYHWLRKYPGQLTSYEIMDGSEYGMWFYFNKSNGDYFFWLLPLDFEYGESLIQRAERCNENVEKNQIPKPAYQELCAKCEFAKTYCFPDKDYGPGFSLISDDELESKLIRWYELKPQSKEFEDLDKEIKEHLKGKSAIIGDFIIESKEFERKNYEVPPEIKEQYLEISTYFKTSIKKLGGNNGTTG